MFKNLLVLLIPTLIFGADSKYSQTAPPRHADMREYYSTGQYKKKAHDQFWNWKYMTGDWYGRREEMAKKGITVTSEYVSNVAGNPIGGREQGATQTGSWGSDLRLDFGKISSAKGLQFYIQTVWRGGNSLSLEKIDNQYPVQQVYGGQNFKVCNLYFEYETPKEIFLVRAGRLCWGDTFLASKFYGRYMNNAFDGNPISTFFNTPGQTAYPNATWATYAKLKPIKRIEMQFGAYNANPRNNANKYHGLNFSFNNELGALLAGDFSFLFNHEKNESGYPGKYTVGAYWTSKESPTFLHGGSKHNYMWYFSFDQMIYRRGEVWSDQGLTLWGAYLFAPRTIATLPFFFTSGLTYKGVIPWRKRDKLSFGVAYGHYSKDLKRSQEIARDTGIAGLNGNRPQSYECDLELNYWAQINDWFYVMPNVMYIFNPKGFNLYDDALVIGAQVGFTF